MRPLFLLLTLGSALLSLARFAHAEAFPWITIGGDDVRRIESVKSDLNLRLDLISKAKESIDIAVYDMRPDDEVTYPLLYALRLAADRGVRVRLLTSYIPLLAADRLKHMAHYLMQPPTVVPIEYEVIGGESIQSWKWGALDTIHEKFFYIDHKYLLSTGRGMGENYENWLDTDFAIRGALARQASQSFEDTWAAAQRQRSPVRNSVLWIFDHYLHVTPHYLLDTKWPSLAEQAEIRSIERWMNETPDLSHGAVQARVLHHDFLHQLEVLPERPTDLGVSARLEILDDPIIDAIVDRLATARVARIAAISLVLNPKLKTALLEAAGRGAQITILTNSTSPDLDDVVNKKTLTPGGAVWDVELPDLDDLLQAGVNVRLFQTNPATPWVYLHRKLAVVDDAVFMGSHNLNLPSTVYNDEMSYEIVNRRLASELAKLYDDDLATNSMAVDAEKVHQTRGTLEEKVLDDVLSPLIGVM